MRSKPLLYLSFFFSLPSLTHAQIFDQGNDNDDLPIVIDAEDSVVCDEGAHTCIATGLAKAQKGTFTLYGDVLTVHFSEGKKNEIIAISADGNVRMEAPEKRAYGEHVHYDVVLDRIRLTGGILKVATPTETLTAKDSIEYWRTDNKGIARGHAVVQLPEDRRIQADVLTAYFKPPSEQKNDEPRKTEIDRLEGEGDLLASGPNGIVTGDRGVYGGDSEVVEVFGDVAVTQGENIIEGGYGRANLKTDVAEIYPFPPHTKPTGPKKRISGLIFPNSFKNKEDKVPAK